MIFRPSILNQEKLQFGSVNRSISFLKPRKHCIVFFMGFFAVIFPKNHSEELFLGSWWGFEIHVATQFWCSRLFRSEKFSPPPEKLPISRKTFPRGLQNLPKSLTSGPQIGLHLFLWYFSQCSLLIRFVCSRFFRGQEFWTPPQLWNFLPCHISSFLIYDILAFAS